MKIHLPVVGPELPVHSTTGLQALGFRRNGAPIWPVRGASPDDPGEGNADTDDSADADDDADDQDDAEGVDKLSDPTSVEYWKARASQWERRAQKPNRALLRPWNALARDLGVKTPEDIRSLIKGKQKDGTDAPDPEQIRREARAEVEQESTRERVLDKIEAKARGFADPADAAALLLREHDVDDFLDGTRVDADAVQEALDDLLEKKPYLAAKNGAERKPAPKKDPSQGNRGGAKPSAQDRASARLARMGLTPKT